MSGWPGAAHEAEMLCRKGSSEEAPGSDSAMVAAMRLCTCTVRARMMRYVRDDGSAALHAPLPHQCVEQTPPEIMKHQADRGESISIAELDAHRKRALMLGIIRCAHRYNRFVTKARASRHVGRRVKRPRECAARLQRRQQLMQRRLVICRGAGGHQLCRLLCMPGHAHLLCLACCALAERVCT